MQKVVAFDPGNHTGWALRDQDGFYCWGTMDDVNGPYHADLYNWLDSEGPEIVVVEAFRYERRPHVDLTAVEYIGVIRAFCQQFNVPCVSSPRDQAKNFWTDTKLVKVDLIPQDRHARDAMRHLLLHLRPVEVLQKLMPDDT